MGYDKGLCLTGCPKHLGTMRRIGKLMLGIVLKDRTLSSADHMMFGLNIFDDIAPDDVIYPDDESSNREDSREFE